MAYLIFHCFAYVKTLMSEVKGIFSRGIVSKCSPIQNKLLNIYYVPDTVQHTLISKGAETLSWLVHTFIPVPGTVTDPQWTFN